jgi:hypothetical protein
MLQIYYNYYVKTLKEKIKINKEKELTFTTQATIFEKEIADFYINTVLSREQFLTALKTGTVTKQIFKNSFDIFTLKINDLKIVKAEEKKFKTKIALAERLLSQINYNVFKIIVDSFLIELRDEFIKGNICVFKVPYFGVFAITLKYPKVRFSKTTGNPIYPVSWHKSRKYKEELIAKGVKVREAGSNEGENWLLPMSDPYPIVRWFKYNMQTSVYYPHIKNLVYRPATTFISDLYRYLDKVPETRGKYETVGNAYLKGIIEWMRQQKVE